MHGVVTLWDGPAPFCIDRQAGIVAGERPLRPLDRAQLNVFSHSKLASTHPPILGPDQLKVDQSELLEV